MIDVNNNEVSTNTSKKKAKRVRIIPATQQELAQTSLTVATHYHAFHTELVWMPKASFAQLVQDFAAEVEVSEREGAKRKPITGDIAVIQQEMNNNLQFVKFEIIRKFGNKRKADHYAEFGLEKIDGTWMLPVDHTIRIVAVKRLIDSMLLHGIGTADYGVAYWQDALLRYDDAVSRGAASDALRRTTVEIKNLNRDLLEKALNALIHLVKAQHPDTFASMLYDWGFQRDKY